MVLANFARIWSKLGQLWLDVDPKEGQHWPNNGRNRATSDNIVPTLVDLWPDVWLFVSQKWPILANIGNKLGDFDQHMDNIILFPGK